VQSLTSTGCWHVQARLETLSKQLEVVTTQRDDITARLESLKGQQEFEVFKRNLAAKKVRCHAPCTSCPLFPRASSAVSSRHMNMRHAARERSRMLFVGLLTARVSALASTGGRGMAASGVDARRRFDRRQLRWRRLHAVTFLWLWNQHPSRPGGAREQDSQSRFQGPLLVCPPTPAKVFGGFPLDGAWSARGPDLMFVGARALRWKDAAGF
jgi:hypothetical protein